MLDFLWDAWANLGLSASGEMSEIDSPLDPEVLILATAIWGRLDARLFDEVLDWMHRHASLLQTSRIRTLSKTYHFSGQRVANAMLDAVAAQDGGPVWKSKKPKKVEAEEVLFSTNPFFGEADPIFKDHGLVRPPVEFRGYSRNFPPDHPAAQMLRLRAFMGISTRADCSLYLASIMEGSMTFHAAGLAKILGYSPQAVAKSLQEMVRSGWVTSFRPPEPSDGRVVSYSATKALRDFVRVSQVQEGLATLKVRKWALILQPLDYLNRVLSKLIEMNASDQIVQSELSRCYVKFHRTDLWEWRDIYPERQTVFDIDSILRFIRSLHGSDAGSSSQPRVSATTSA